MGTLMWQCLCCSVCIPIPIAAWPRAACDPQNKEICEGGPEDGPKYAMWRWVLDEFYNNPNYADIVYRIVDPRIGARA